jgi:NADPH-dependent glutamate synthase beta subunit-like oxidoreductase
MVKGAVPVFSNVAVRLTGLEVPTIVFGNARLVVGRVTTGDVRVTTDSTTEVEL